MPTKKEIERLLRTGVRPEESPKKSRQEYNREILKNISSLIEIFPDQRFGQIICNYIFPDYQERDPFFEEPKDTLERLQSLGRYV